MTFPVSVFSFDFSLCIFARRVMFYLEPERLGFLLFPPFLAGVTAACELDSVPSSPGMPNQPAGQDCELEGHATAMSLCVKPYRRASACLIRD
jgi:hypothetical protein